MAFPGPVDKLVLASRSASRRAMLSGAGVEHDSCPAEIDERALESGMGDAGPDAVAIALAGAKALAISALQPDRLVLGSDSLIVVAGQRFDKAASRGEAAAHLRRFSGREMELHSAAALARAGEILWQAADRASLRVRSLSERFIAAYVDAEWPDVAGCAGVFRIEGMGAQLFEHIEGSHFTVLGMPLLPVLAALRQFGLLET